MVRISFSDDIPSVEASGINDFIKPIIGNHDASAAEVHKSDFLADVVGWLPDPAVVIASRNEY